MISHKFLFHFKISYDCWIKCKFNLDKFKNYLAKDLKNNSNIQNSIQGDKMKKLGLVLAVLVALNVSAFADLIVINKKDLVPVSASEM